MPTESGFGAHQLRLVLTAFQQDSRQLTIGTINGDLALTLVLQRGALAVETTAGAVFAVNGEPVDLWVSPEHIWT